MMLERTFLLFSLTCLTSANALIDSCFKDPWLQKANYSTCPGNKFTLDLVDISTTYHTKLHRHVLFKNDIVSFCIAGKATGLVDDVLYLQNSVHGSVRVKLDIPLLGNVLDQGLKTPFCDIDNDRGRQPLRIASVSHEMKISVFGNISHFSPVSNLFFQMW